MKVMPNWFYYICWFFIAVSQLFTWAIYSAMVVAWLVILHYWPSQDNYFTEALSVVGTIMYFAYQTFSIESELSNQSQVIFKENAITNYFVNKFGYENSFIEVMYVDPRGDIEALEKLRAIALTKDNQPVKAIFCGSDWSQLKNGNIDDHDGK